MSKFKKLIVINGANLNLLGQRENDIYGDLSFEEYLVQLRGENPEIEIDYFQSNWEGELVSKIQEADKQYEGIILNAGGYTHTSVVLGDSIRAISTPVVEVHISNICAREFYRHRSYISPHAAGCIFGFGLEGYRLAIDYFVHLWED